MACGLSFTLEESRIAAGEPRHEWDPITTTPSGFVIWKRCGDGEIVVTRPGQTPEQALEEEADHQ
jgi:hypothetical protein